MGFKVFLTNGGFSIAMFDELPKTIPPKNNHVSIVKIMAKHLFLVRQPVTQMRQSRVCLYLPLLVCRPDSHSKLKGTCVQRIPAETNYACVCRSGPDIKHVVVDFSRERLSAGFFQ